MIFTTLKPDDKWDDISSSIGTCIVNISIWINSKMLKLNIFIQVNYGKKENDRITAGSTFTYSSISVRYLGLILINRLDIEKVINNIYESRGIIK